MDRPPNILELRQQLEALKQLEHLEGWKLFRDDQLKGTRAAIEVMADPKTAPDMRTFLAGSINWQKKNAEWLKNKIKEVSTVLAAEEKAQQNQKEK